MGSPGVSGKQTGLPVWSPGLPLTGVRLRAGREPSRNVSHLLEKDTVMIYLTRLNDSKIVINSDLIEFIESIPDTIITLTTGQKLMVKESVDDVVSKVTEYKRSIFHKPIANIGR